MLRALACFGVLDEPEPGTFALGPHGRGLLTDDPESMRHLVLLFAGNGVWRSWGERTATELRDLLAAGGFTLDRITPVSGPTNFSVLEATPRP